MSDLSPRQTGLLVHIAIYSAQKGYAPSFRDLSDAMGGISTNAVANHITACIRKGYLAKAIGRARTLTITPKGEALLATLAPSPEEVKRIGGR